MSELEKIFEKYGYPFQDAKIMGFVGFQKALTEVFDKVRVTDEEVEKRISVFT